MISKELAETKGWGRGLAQARWSKQGLDCLYPHREPAEAANREGAYTPRVRSSLALLQGMKRLKKTFIGAPRCMPVFREIVLVARGRLSKLEAGQPSMERCGRQC